MIDEPKVTALAKQLYDARKSRRQLRHFSGFRSVTELRSALPLSSPDKNPTLTILAVAWRNSARIVELAAARSL